MHRKQMLWVTGVVSLVLGSHALAQQPDRVMLDMDTDKDKAKTPTALDNNIHWGGIASEVLWNNGRHDELNGLSNATEHAFGDRRTLLFDVVVPEDAFWDVSGLEWLAVWNTVDPPAGSGAVLRFHDDAGNAPGTPITEIILSSGYEEIPTLYYRLGRPEYTAKAEIESRLLWPGRYWIEATVVGPENNFWLTAAVIDNQCWVDYEDFGGLQPGSNVFNTEYDITAVVTGSEFATYDLSVTGTCPGRVTVAWSRATPGHQQGLVMGNRLGRTVNPHVCSGTIFGMVGGVRLVDPPGFFSTGENGTGSITGQAGSNACGKYLQLIEGGTCIVSNVAQIP